MLAAAALLAVVALLAFRDSPKIDAVSSGPTYSAKPFGQYLITKQPPDSLPQPPMFAPVCDGPDCCPIRNILSEEHLLDELMQFLGPGACKLRGKCVSGPIGFPCLNRLPLPCSLPYLGDDQSRSSSKRTAYSDDPVSKAVLTLAVGDGYGPEWLSVFAGSLRRTGYDGLIVVMVERPPTQLMLSLYNVLDVESVIIDVEAYPTRRLTAIRFLAYEEFIVSQHARLKDALIFHCDSRDVYFQKDPFDFEWPASVTGFPSTRDRDALTGQPTIVPFTGTATHQHMLYPI